MTDEEAFFEVWFNLQRFEHWKKRYPDEPMPEGWGLGAKGAMWKAWYGRATFHVTPNRAAEGK